MSKTIQKKKGLGELPLFRSMSIFISGLVPVMMNLQKDIKHTFGYEILRLSIESVRFLRKSYREPGNREKLAYIGRLNDNIGDIEILTKILFEAKQIPESAQANISIQLADILTQLTGWMKSVEKGLQ